MKAGDHSGDDKEGVADGASSATYGALAVSFATVTGQRRQAGKLGDPLMGQSSISGISAIKRLAVRLATPLMVRKLAFSCRHRGSASINWAMAFSKLRI